MVYCIEIYHDSWTGERRQLSTSNSIDERNDGIYIRLRASSKSEALEKIKDLSSELSMFEEDDFVDP